MIDKNNAQDAVVVDEYQPENITIEKIDDSVADALTMDGIVMFRAHTITREQLPDRTDVVVVHSGYKVKIPSGFVGYLYATHDVAGSSLIPAAPVQIIQGGQEQDVMIAFKLTTNSAPAVFRTTIGERNDKKNDNKTDGEKVGGVFAAFEVHPVTKLPIYVTHAAKSKDVDEAKPATNDAKPNANNSTDKKENA